MSIWFYTTIFLTITLVVVVVIFDAAFRRLKMTNEKGHQSTKL